MGLATAGLSHVSIRVTDLARAKQFYTGTLGFQQVLEADGLVLVSAGGMLLGIRGDARETPSGDRFNPFRVGLDHLALAVPSEDRLQLLKGQLDAAGVPNNGVEHDQLTGAAWELYALPG